MKVHMLSNESVHMLIWKCAHAQLVVCICWSVSVHRLNWYAHAHLKVYACSPGSEHILMWKHVQAQLEACACSTGSVHMLNWKCVHALFLDNSARFGIVKQGTNMQQYAERAKILTYARCQHSHTDFNKRFQKISSTKWHWFMCWQFKCHILNLLNSVFKPLCHIIQCNIDANHKRAHAQV